LAAGAGVFGLALGCCANLPSPAGPPPAFDLHKDISDLSAQFGTATSVAAYYSQPETEARRNAFVVGRLTLYNLQYIDYIGRFALGQAVTQSAFDLAKLGVDLSGALVGRPYAKTVLGAASAALTGSRPSSERNLFDDETTAALVAQMNAGRKSALVPILAGLQRPLADYPLSTAIVDLESFYEAGTPQGALTGVQAAAAQQAMAADQQIAQYRTLSFGQDSASTAIRAWLYPTAARKGPGGAMLLANGGPASADPTRAAQVRRWMTANGWGDLPVRRLLDGPTFAAARQTAVGALAIPSS
jgi:hypothetical protein